MSRPALQPPKIFRYVLTLLALAATAAPPALAQSRDTAVDGEGLLRFSVRGIDSAAQRPDVDWQRYDKVWVVATDVAFSKAWDPRSYGRFGLDERAVTKIRDDLAKLATGEFSAVLAAGGRKLADGPGPGVLEVRIQIIDLYINAPPRDEFDPLYTYTLESGEMTLALELRDSVTGTLLGRFRDRYRDTGIGVFTLSNEVTRQAENRRVLQEWAKILKGLLAASPIGP